MLIAVVEQHNTLARSDLKQPPEHHSNYIPEVTLSGRQAPWIEKHSL